MITLILNIYFLIFHFFIYSCIGYNRTKIDNKPLECSPVYNYRFVLYRSGPDQCWEDAQVKVARVPVGCACINKSELKLDEDE